MIIVDFALIWLRRRWIGSRILFFFNLIAIAGTRWFFGLVICWRNCFFVVMVMIFFVIIIADIGIGGSIRISSSSIGRFHIPSWTVLYTTVRAAINTVGRAVAIAALLVVIVGEMDLLLHRFELPNQTAIAIAVIITTTIVVVIVACTRTRGIVIGIVVILFLFGIYSERWELLFWSRLLGWLFVVSIVCSPLGAFTRGDWILGTSSCSIIIIIIIVVVARRWFVCFGWRACGRILVGDRN